MSRKPNRPRPIWGYEWDGPTVFTPEPIPSDAVIELPEHIRERVTDDQAKLLKAVSRIHQMGLAIDRTQADSVTYARAGGVPWALIAPLLGVTDEGARKKFRTD